MAQQQQQQQYYASSPNHGEFHGYHYVDSAGSSLGMQLNGAHQNHVLDHLDDPHAEPIPNIYEQTPESDGGYNDLTLLSDPTMESMLHNSFVGLGLHSPTQPSQAADFAPYLPSAKPDPSSPIYAAGPPSPSQVVVVPSQRSSPTPLNLANLPPPFLSPAHSPSLSPHVGGTSPCSDGGDWESSSQVSFDGGSASPPEFGLRRSHSASSANVGEGKSYRRNIEKKSRDKKNGAYTRLKKQLEDMTHKSYTQRSQAEVLDGATNLLATQMQDNQHLLLHNQALMDKLKQYGLWETD